MLSFYSACYQKCCMWVVGTLAVNEECNAELLHCTTRLDYLFPEANLTGHFGIVCVSLFLILHSVLQIVNSYQPKIFGKVVKAAIEHCPHQMLPRYTVWFKGLASRVRPALSLVYLIHVSFHFVKSELAGRFLQVNQ